MLHPFILNALHSPHHHRYPARYTLILFFQQCIFVAPHHLHPSLCKSVIHNFFLLVFTQTLQLPRIPVTHLTHPAPLPSSPQMAGLKEPCLVQLPPLSPPNSWSCTEPAGKLNCLCWWSSRLATPPWLFSIVLAKGLIGKTLVNEVSLKCLTSDLRLEEICTLM